MPCVHTILTEHLLCARYDVGANTAQFWPTGSLSSSGDDRYTLKLNNYLIAVVTYTMKESIVNNKGIKRETCNTQLIAKAGYPYLA